MAALYFRSSLFPSPGPEKKSEIIPLEGELSGRLDEFAGNVVSGGPPKDGIPSIDSPKYVSPDKAGTFLKMNDVVFGLDYQGVVRAYPQTILVWHEIVNDMVAGEKVSITYCPLTGSAVAFKGRSRVDGKELTFGTSGNLVNSNLLMYDRQSDSNWPQILGTAMNGPNKGNVLQQIPLDWTTWQRWKVKHPETQVLSTDTGHFRFYGSDPYGSYIGKSGYYYSEGTFFPIMARDTRFHSKKVVVGLQVGDSFLAVPKEEFWVRKLDNIVLGGEPILLLYDGELDLVRAYSRQVEGRTLKFTFRDDKLVDEQTSSEWTSRGLSIRGKLAETQLRPVNYFDVMWFAWYAFYPQTKFYG